jgi:hypothetical protein
MLGLSLRRRLLILAAAASAFGGTTAAIPTHASATTTTTTTTDPILYWNDVLLDAYRQAGGAPGPLARAGAMMHVAIYDAVNSITPQGQPYTIHSYSPGVSTTHAIAYAAHDTLAAVFPSLNFSTKLNEALAQAGTDNGGAGAALGKKVAAAGIALRNNDGSANPMSYQPSNDPGYWRPTGSGNAVTPDWGLVKSFTMTSGSQFRPPLPGGFATMPELLRSPLYAQQLNESKDLGSATSQSRTDEQTRIAHFWANDVDMTYKPPGQHFSHTQAIASARNLTTAQSAKLFAMVGLAMADAGIAAWDAKYQTNIDLWRPETAIHDAELDGNDATAEDDLWKPLSIDRDGNRFSPAFPAYVSGHATFAGAWANATRLYFGTDNIAFTGDTDDPYATPKERNFSSLTAAAVEDARSRVYLGVHYQFDADSGLATGKSIAENINQNFLRTAQPTVRELTDSCVSGNAYKTYSNGTLSEPNFSLFQAINGVNVLFAAGGKSFIEDPVYDLRGWVPDNCFLN